MIHVDFASDVPIYQQIEEQVRMAVAAGRLRPGDRLEPVRELAAQLGVNASTVARAYLLLEHAGVIETNRRRGSVIAARVEDPELRALREQRLQSIMQRALVEVLAMGYRAEEAEAAFGLELAAWNQRRQPPSRDAEPEAALTGAVLFAGSHDLALEALWARSRLAYPGLDLSIRYTGSLEGLVALWQGDATLAGVHLLDEETGEYNLPIVRRLFPGRSMRVVTLAERRQGLLVPPSNPRRLATWRDLAQPDLRFANRQIGSGTRTLLDLHLRREGVSPWAIPGYSSGLPTHLAVAAAVAEGRADAGLGLLAAARAYGLDFVPLASERYDLVLYAAHREKAPLRDLLEMVCSAGFRAVVAELGGYDVTQSGHEMWL
jgi:molybdate-binding protein/DNA-binding transcriptional regulator YhcF (GntR family)